MEHPQKAAPEAEAQGGGGLRLEGEGGVVELELLQRVPEVGVLGAVLGVDAAVDHAPGGAVAGEGLGGGVVHGGDGVAHLGVLHVFDGGGEVAHLPGGQALTGLQLGGQEVADLHQAVLRAGGHHPHPLVQGEGALHHPEIDHHPPVGVVLAVKDQGLEGGLGVPLGGGDVVDDVLQHRLDVGAHLGGDLRGLGGLQADDVLHLLLGQGGVGGGEVDLVDHRADLQIVLHGQVGVGQGLGLHPLGGVHHQDGPLAGGQGAGDLIVEVHVARGVDEVEGIGLAVQGIIVDGHRPGLDGDAPLPLQVHVVQELVLHLPFRHRVAQLQQPVSQRGFSVVDVGDDGKVSNLALVYHSSLCPPLGKSAPARVRRTSGLQRKPLAEPNSLRRS